jgi:hypothetical protein
MISQAVIEHWSKARGGRGIVIDHGCNDTAQDSHTGQLRAGRPASLEV